MADAQDLYETLETLDVTAIALDVLESKTEVIADLNAVQMSMSKRSDDSDILPSYADLTIQIKQAEGIGLGAITDRVTLFMTGAHYRELFAALRGDVLEIASTVGYSEDLEEKYDTAKGKIHWLNEDSKDELAESHTGPAFKEQVEKQTGLKFQ